MYKLSVGHAKKFCGFFASTAGFQKSSAEFSAKPAGIRWSNFWKIRPIIRLIRPNFVFSKFSCSFRTSTAFQPNFLGFQWFFSKFFKMRRNRWEVIFHCPPNFVTLVTTRVNKFDTFCQNLPNFIVHKFKKKISKNM
jgi:hypothetical protein